MKEVIIIWSTIMLITLAGMSVYIKNQCDSIIKTQTKLEQRVYKLELGYHNSIKYQKGKERTHAEWMYYTGCGCHK